MSPNRAALRKTELINKELVKQEMIATSESILDASPQVPTARVLAVDDNPANLASIRAVLEDLDGASIVYANSGEEALRELLHEEFAVVLLDVRMPRMDGLECADIIRKRERTKHLPIIFLTAHDRDDELVNRAYSMGAVDFLFKPIQPEILLAKTRVFVELQHRSEQIREQAEQLAKAQRKEAEQQLLMERERWATEQLREENKRKDEFLAVLAHELRNPLAPVVTGVELIKMYDIDHPQLEKTRASMEQQLSHLNHLVDDLLDISRISSGKIVLREDTVNLFDVVYQAVENCRCELEDKQHELNLELGDDPAYVHGDAVRLTQVVGNLISNSARYTPEHGAITVACQQKDGHVSLSVEDNGMGIEQPMLQQVFGQFVQGDGHNPGLGLGLALVKMLVELHDGQVEARSEGKNQGSTFIVTLPTIPAPRNNDEQTQSTEHSSQPGESLRIALVEDDAGVRTVISELLKLWGHEVIIAVNGAEGIEVIKAEQPDVAIVDVGMPDMTGYDVAKAVRKQGGHDAVKMICMTGYGQPEDVEKAMAAGFDTHLTKPATASQLTDALSRMREKQD